jgi:protein phosphatase
VIRFSCGAATDVGLVRTVNEDGYLVTESLFAVADGMGGHRAGDVASSEALEVLRTAVLLPTLEDLVAAVEAANHIVYEKSISDPELSGMGTTLCAVALLERGEGDPERCGVVNVGDSRVYLYSGELHQISEDHSLVESMVRSGQLTPAEAAIHPGRNVLTRALGVEPDVLVDSWAVEIEPGDRFLLCSDGLVNEVPDDEIGEVLAQQPDPQAAADELIRLALEAGGHDNITVIVLDVVDNNGGAPHRRVLADRVARFSGPEDELFDRLLTEPAPLPTRDVLGEDPATPAAASPPVTTVRNPSRRVVTRRSVAFVGAITLVFAAAFGAVWYAARQTYFVAADGGEVAVFRGRPGGLLWFQPILIERTGIAVETLTEDQRSKLTPGHQLGSRGAADAFVERLRPTTTTTTTIPATTTIPPTTTAIDLLPTLPPPG